MKQKYEIIALLLAILCSMLILIFIQPESHRTYIRNNEEITKFMYDETEREITDSNVQEIILALRDSIEKD